MRTSVQCEYTIFQEKSCNTRYVSRVSTSNNMTNKPSFSKSEDSQMVEVLSHVEASFSEREFVLSQGYRINRVVGKGSYAKVYQCETQTGLTKFNNIACKIVNVIDIKAEFVHKFFPRELEILTKLKHPNIIQVLGVYKRDRKFYIFMRYAENKDLLEYVITKGEVSEAKARFWSWQIASALSYMHSQNIVHRDLKCENILLTENYNIKICDFGFGKILANGEEGLSRTWCGSLAYTPPEILEMRPYNPKKVDPWSLGVILYVMLSKTLPFREKTPRAMLAKQKRRLTFNGKQWVTVSSHAKMSLLRLLEVEPKARWSPDNVLNCTWILEDHRLVELNLDEFRRAPPDLIAPDKRRLSAQLREPSTQTSRSVRERSISIRSDTSFNFFQDTVRNPFLPNRRPNSNSSDVTDITDDPSSGDDLE